MYANDANLLWGLARAELMGGEYAEAHASAAKILKVKPGFRTGEVKLLQARALEGQQQFTDALLAYAEAAPLFVGEEGRCRYGLLLQQVGKADKARDVFAEVVRNGERGDSHYRGTQREWIQLAKKQLTQA